MSRNGSGWVGEGLREWMCERWVGAEVEVLRSEKRWTRRKELLYSARGQQRTTARPGMRGGPPGRRDEVAGMVP